MTEQVQIEFNNVCKTYQKNLVLDHVNLKLHGSRINCIMGVSGSGKSTLLRMINRLLSPSNADGEVWVNGENLNHLNTRQLEHFRQHQVSMVFQQIALFPFLTVCENIAYGLKVQGMSKKERMARSEHWLKEVGLEGCGCRYPHALSGGQQQRVGIARAFACDTPILLMDEPFSALDPINRRSLQDLVLQLQQKWQKNVVFVTHDLDEAAYISDFVVLMKAGKIEQQGTFTDLLNHPANDYVKDFMQHSVKVLPKGEQ